MDPQYFANLSSKPNVILNLFFIGGRTGLTPNKVMIFILFVNCGCYGVTMVDCKESTSVAGWWDGVGVVKGPLTPDDGPGF